MTRFSTDIKRILCHHYLTGALLLDTIRMIVAACRTSDQNNRLEFRDYPNLSKCMEQKRTRLQKAQRESQSITTCTYKAKLYHTLAKLDSNTILGCICFHLCSWWSIKAE